MKPTSLRESIVLTLAYFDGYLYPLTLLEVTQFLMMSPHGGCSESEILAELQAVDEIVTAEGFYFLKGGRADIQIRKERYLLAERKYARALEAGRLLSRIPFVRSVAVCNDLALSDAPDDSDIDVFIIVQAGHIWFVRLWASLFMKILGRRPTKEFRRDTICLSFFASSDSLNLASLALPSREEIPDLYLIVWCATLVHLYDAGGFAEQFWAVNGWIRDTLPSVEIGITHPLRRVELDKVSESLKLVCEKGAMLLGSLSEKWARTIQMRVLPGYLRETMNLDSRVILSDSYLKFHPNDRREQYRAQCLERFNRVVADMKPSL